jgi:RNA polymerase sigma-70 factor (TIGR02960 family)
VTAAELIGRAQAGDEDAFRELVEPHRRELQVHCYRILGSMHEAEDAMQETLLSAWQGLARFEGRSSLRTWLFRVATSRCLNALRALGRRGAARERGPDRSFPEPTRMGEVLWIEPCPDVLLEGLPDASPGPEARYEAREAISLAFVTALQLLPPRQRAVLILRDVLGFRATEVAQMIDSTQESVTSALKRARATLQPSHHVPPSPSTPVERETVERFTRAFEAQDVAALVAMLTDDVSVTMPPLPIEYVGPEAAGRFLRAATAWQGRGPRLVATRANGQPAFGLYTRDPRADVLHAVGLLVLTLAGSRICAITRFENGVLHHFGLPRTAPLD